MKDQQNKVAYPRIIGIEQVNAFIGGTYFRITVGGPWGMNRVIELDELPEGITVGTRIKRIHLTIEEPGPED